MKASWPGPRTSSKPVAKGRPSPSRISQYMKDALPLKRNAIFLGLTMLTAIGLYGLALVSAGSLLVVEDPPAQADVIVVLGGDGPPRAAQAAKLWHEGKGAPRSGDWLRGLRRHPRHAGADGCRFRSHYNGMSFGQYLGKRDVRTAAADWNGSKTCHSGHELVSFTACGKALPVCDASNPVGFPSCATNRVAVAACRRCRRGTGVQGVRQDVLLRPQKQLRAGFTPVQVGLAS